MSFILDCSVAISWIFPDESNFYADIVLQSLAFNSALVPAVFYWEIVNVLWVGEQRQRVTEAQADAALTALWSVDITADAFPSPGILEMTLHLGRTYGLAAYDAAYLELALRQRLPLVTIDARLTEAARKAGVFLNDPTVLLL